MGSACLYDINMFHNKNGYEIGLTSINFVVFYYFFVLLDRMSEVMGLMFLARTNCEGFLK